MAEYRELTQDELLTELQERFGEDPMEWAFQCPHCSDVATARDFREALAANPRKNQNGSETTASDVIGQECIGRTLGALEHAVGEHYIGRGCNWAAYGLFHGPWKVTLPGGGEMWCFPIAPAPAATGANRA